MPNEHKQRALFIGLGGSGVKTVLKTRQRLLDRTEGATESERRKAFHDLYRFVMVDTDKLSRSMVEAEVPLSEEEDLGNDHVDLGSVVPLQVYSAARSSEQRTPRQRRLIEFVGTTLTRDLRQNSLRNGAGAYRVNSRIGLQEKYDRVRSIVSSAIDTLTSEGNITGIKPGSSLCVWVVSGLAGGTGSGILLDVLYLADRVLRQKGQAAPQIRAVLFTPGSFTNFHNPEIIMSNGYSAMQEIGYFLSNSQNNHFQHVSVVPDDANWFGDKFSYWPVYHSAIPIDSTINGGGAMTDKSLYENSAEMLTCLQLSAAEGAAASPLDNTLQDAGGTDKLTAFGYVALKKPVHLFRRYLHARRLLEVCDAFLGVDFQETTENTRLASDWIERVIESITGRILTRNDSIEGQIAKDESVSLGQEQLDHWTTRDEEQSMTQGGGDTGINLRRSIKARFETLNGGSAENNSENLEAKLDQYFNNNFFDEKSRFIKKSPHENSVTFVAESLREILRAESDCFNQFREIQSSFSKTSFQWAISESVRRAVNRSISDQGVAFTAGLVVKCDKDLDNLRQTSLAGLAKNLQKMRLVLATEVQAFEVKTEGDAEELRRKIKILLALVKESMVARCQSELIAWLCEGDTGWIDREIVHGLSDLRGEAVKARETSKAEYEINLPKLFRTSSSEVTTRYLPDPVDMLSSEGWKATRTNEFSRYYTSLFPEATNSPRTLLGKIGSGISVAADELDDDFFASFLPKESGGDSRSPSRIISVIKNQVSAGTEVAIKTSAGSEALEFLEKPLVEVFKNAPPERQTELRRIFGATDRLFFPLAQGSASGGKPISIYAGTNKDFARELGYNEPGNYWVQDSDSNVLLKLYFEGAFSFKDYYHYGSAEGSYRSVLQKLIEEGREDHQPHIHRSFVNGSEIGDNVADAMHGMLPIARDLMGGIKTPEEDFDRLFATCWLYSELSKHLTSEILGMVYEQELVAGRTIYSPFSLRKDKAMQYGGWIDSADAIQLRDGKIKISAARMKDHVGRYKGNVFDVYPCMKREDASIIAVLKDFEQKLRRANHRDQLMGGMSAAVAEMLRHLNDDCMIDSRTKGTWGKQIETAIELLSSDDGILPYIHHILQS